MALRNDLTDEAVLAELGARLARRRLALALTQAQLAEAAGVGKRTVERLEAGASVQLVSLVRVLRALDLLASLDAWLPAVRPGPLDLLEREGRVRQRASGEQGAGEAPWTWGEEP